MGKTTTQARIAFIVPLSTLYGGGLSLVEVLAKLDRRYCFMPLVVTAKEGPLEDALRAIGVEVTRIPWLFEKPKMRLDKRIIQIFRFAIWVRRNRINLVRFSLHHKADLGIIALGARFGGARFIVHNLIKTTWPSLYDKFWLSTADLLTTVSKDAASHWFLPRRSDLWSRINASRIRVVPNGRRMKELKAIPYERSLVHALGIPDDAIIVGMVGKIHPIKKTDIFLKIASLISKELPNVWFVHVGSHDQTSHCIDYKQSLDQLAEQLKISDRFKFTGYRSDAKKFMKLFSVMTLTSEKEGLPGVLLEATGIGIPIVSANISGASEIIEDGKTGFVIKSYKPRDYVQAILKILREPMLAEEMHRAALSKAKQFDIEVATKSLACSLEDVLEAHT